MERVVYVRVANPHDPHAWLARDDVFGARTAHDLLALGITWGHILHARACARDAPALRHAEGILRRGGADVLGKRLYDSAAAP